MTDYSYQTELERQFLISIKDGNAEKIKELLIKEPRYPFTNIRDTQGDRPLHIAASYGHDEILKTLLQSVSKI